MFNAFALDDLLVQINAARQWPAYRRRLLEGISVLDGIGGLRVLRALERHAKPHEHATVRDVATVMGIGRSAASRAVDEVCRRGLVDKNLRTDDLRMTRLSLTECGRRVLEQADENRQRLLAVATAGWSPAEVTELTTLLTKLLAGYEAIEAERFRTD